MLSIGPYLLESPIILAPMAGVTDLPFRKICKRMGAGLVVGEMVSCDPTLRNTRKSRLRMTHDSEVSPIAIQIVGNDPIKMAESARFNVSMGAQMIDINLGCPAKKVCRKAAGSALLKDEPLVKDILSAVVEAVDVPVTVKMRTGWDKQHRNAPKIADFADKIGVSAIAVHGRTRECGFQGVVEHDTLRTIKQQVSIPVFANGDIDSAEKVVDVMKDTGADGVLIGRGAQGNPWIFKQTAYLLKTGRLLPSVEQTELEQVIVSHIQELYAFYGELTGVRLARKHVAWYLRSLGCDREVYRPFNRLLTGEAQLYFLNVFFKTIKKSIKGL